MADLYTSLYGSKAGVGTASGALTATTTYFYNGPTIGQEGQTCTRVGTYTGTIATTDVLHLCGGLRDGERLVSLSIGLTVDSDTGNDITVDIGTTSDPDGIANDSTILQAVTGGLITASVQNLTTLVAVNGEEYILTATNATETSATITFTIVTTV